MTGFKIDLPKFSGTNDDAFDVHQWFRQFEVAAQFSNWDKTHLPPRARLSLQGSALDFSGSLGENVLEDWGSFKKKIATVWVRIPGVDD